MKIYLAGPIHGMTDAACRDWRRDAASFLRLAGNEVSDPLDRDYRGTEDEYAEQLVSDDKDAIESCDALLVNANSPGWGTAMEVLYAVQLGKTVVAFATHGNAPSVSPWLRCHTTAIYESLSSAIAGITNHSITGMR